MLAKGLPEDPMVFTIAPSSNTISLIAQSPWLVAVTETRMNTSKLERKYSPQNSYFRNLII